MNTITDQTLGIAVCDQYAFYPFRSLVSGGLNDWTDVEHAERFIRTVLLHDYLELDGEPMPAHEEDEEWSDAEIAAGGRNVITAFLPTLDGYEEIISSPLGPFREMAIELPRRLVELAVSSSGTADLNNAYYRSHVRYINDLALVVKRGGSVLAAGEVGRSVFSVCSEMPAALFANLDADVRAFAEQANRGDLGLVTPPFLAALLRRAGRRDRIIEALAEMRAEWAQSRRSIWEIVHALRRTPDLREAQDRMRELGEISQRIRLPGAPAIRPGQVAWQVTTEAGAAAVEAWVTGGNPLFGATVAVGARGIGAVGTVGRRLFGLGGFGLARVVAREVQDYRPSIEQLNAILTPAERTALSL